MDADLARLADPLLADRRRRQIMDAALACFTRRGFHQATMQEICGEAAMSAGAIYRYFGSKAEIIAAIAEESRLEGTSAFIRAIERSGFIEGMCLIAESFFQQCSPNDGALIADVIAESLRDDLLAATLRTSAARTNALLAGELRAAQKTGEVDSSLDPEIAAGTLLAAMEGLALRRAFMHADPQAAVAQFRALAERFLKPSP